MVQLSHPQMTTGKTIALTIYRRLLAKWCLCFIIHCLGLFPCLGPLEMLNALKPVQLFVQHGAELIRTDTQLWLWALQIQSMLFCCEKSKEMGSYVNRTGSSNVHSWNLERARWIRSCSETVSEWMTQSNTSFLLRSKGMRRTESFLFIRYQVIYIITRNVFIARNI